MGSARRTTLVLILALLVTSVGLFEAAIGRNGDLLAVLAVAVGLQLALLAGARTGRRAVDLRADLATWIDDHALSTGEPAHRLLDRCVAAYQAELSAPDSTTARTPARE